jgi:hypothetical protein
MIREQIEEADTAIKTLKSSIEVHSMFKIIFVKLIKQENIHKNFLTIIHF